MTFEDYALARQYLVEHRIGTRLREQKRTEDQQAHKAKQAITRRR